MTRIRRGRTSDTPRRTRRVAFGLGRIGGPDLKRRLRAAGLRSGDETAERSIDESRDALARTIAMTINCWPGCPEPACKRARGCMAPRILCSNAQDKPMSERARARATARLMRQLKAAVAQVNAAEDAAAALEAPLVPAKAGTRS